MSQNTLVSIICTCYNQERYVEEALQSVVNQSYGNIELIVIDDCSNDNSLHHIKNFLKERPDIVLIENKERIGLCKGFNTGLNISSGKYVIDLSGDDVLLPSRVAMQVDFFEKLEDDFGVIYSNAEVVDTHGRHLSYSYGDRNGVVKDMPPEGMIYKKLIENTVVATQTMMMRRHVMDELGGYDEELAYEDFDFWVRSSRKWKYAYQNEVLTRIRKTPGSLSTKQYVADDPQLLSTYKVCQKIKRLNRDKQEDEALIRRLKYEIKHAVLAEKKREGELFLQLLNEMTPLNSRDLFYKELNDLGLKTAWIRKALMALKK